MIGIVREMEREGGLPAENASSQDETQGADQIVRRVHGRSRSGYVCVYMSLSLSSYHWTALSVQEVGHGVGCVRVFTAFSEKNGLEF